MFRFVLLLSLIASCVAHAGHLQRFTPVANADDYPRGVSISPRYEVWVKPADDSTPWDAAIHRTATYMLWPDYLDPETLPAKHAETAVHLAQVDADARVRVRVALIDGDQISTLRLKPTRLTELDATKSATDRVVEFEIEPYRYTRSVLVEINAPAKDSDALQDGLMFFLNPPSRRPSGNVLELPSGIIDASSPHVDELNRILITEDSPYDALYIPQDTIVDGRVEVQKPGFKVMGRGMIVGSRWPFVKAVPGWRDRYPDYISPSGKWVRPLLSYDHPDGATPDDSSMFEGVLVAHPYHFCVGWAYWNENLKTFGWRFSSDGIHGTHKRGSFMRVNDDATYISSGSVEDCVYWHLVNGAILQLGWGLSRDNDTPAHAKRLDVLRGEWDNAPNPGQDRLGSPSDAPPTTPRYASHNRGVIVGTYRGGQAFTVRNKHFEDIRVDAQVNRLIYLGSRTELVSYENFVFKDITFETSPAYTDLVTNVLRGGSIMNHIVFDNFRVADKKVMSLEDLEPLSAKNLGRIIFR